MVKRSNSDKPLYCSFCGKTQRQVECLVAGPHVFICNQCIGICVSYLPPRHKWKALVTIGLPWKWRYGPRRDAEQPSAPMV